MSRHDDDERSRYRTRGDDIRERNLRDPYEARRQVRTYESDDGWAAEHPWQAAHPPRDEGRRAERSARDGGYRDDEELWSRPRDARGDARYGLDTEAERHFAQEHPNPGSRRREHGRDRGDHRQSNSGYDATRAYGQGSRQDDARSDYAHASWTQEHDYQGPRYGTPHRPGRGGEGSQHAHEDTYGSAGFRQQGKRYWFDGSDERGHFRGTPPRGYQRSDERLRELACERLTDADLDASDIEVKVSQATVTLEGSVSARWMKHQAEDLIDDLGGVKDIQNHLRVNRDEGGAGGAQALPGAIGSPAQGSSAGGGSSKPAAGASDPGGDIGGRSRH